MLDVNVTEANSHFIKVTKEHKAHFIAVTYILLKFY